MKPMFADRSAAGELLAAAVRRTLAGRQGSMLVIGLARGGYTVGAEVARRLDLPLDLMVVRRLRVPAAEQLVFGAVTSSGGTYFHRNQVRNARLSDEQIRAVADREATEALTELRAWQPDRVAARIEGRAVLLVDDGMVSGVAMCAAADDVRRSLPVRVVAAVPVAAAEGIERVSSHVDEMIYLSTLPPFDRIADCYESYDWIDDAHMMDLLRATQPAGGRRV